MRKLLFTLLTILTGMGAMAANTDVTVSQVTNAVSLTNDVDYHITSTTPFTSTGSIDIVNTDHAVVIIDNLKPSLAKQWLGYITINGAKAYDGTNCEVRMYNNGAIIFPYPNDIKPLTVFEEADFKGESYDNFGLENSGGYMNTLQGTRKAWNNRIRSFRLKRGYMVTFSLLASGRGYSRCFIADKEDIAINLPTLMAGRISSYRIFKWWNFSKKGIANATGSTIINALNATGCFDWAQGNNDRLPDCEWVPNHIYEDYPSSSTCGSVTGSPHMKTNNEPLNASDDHPQSLDDILANWENLMRTGQRLCAPASWDGSPNFTKQFLDSIDARGWRCDIIDLHCYWTEGSFNNIGNQYNTYGQRPIWISEFCWGASWNNNGVFAYRDNMDEGRNQNRIVMGRILDRLNSWDYVERYFYWNSEHDVSKIYKDSKLTPLGEYYAQMNTGLGYKSNHQHTPKGPRITPPKMSELKFNVSNSVATISWTDKNGDIIDAMYLERSINGSTDWQIVKQVNVSDDATTYSATDTISLPGKYAYRVRTVAYNNSVRYSGEIYNVINGTEKLGAPLLQYGKMEAVDKNDTYNYFTEAYPYDANGTVPAIVFGSITNINGKAMLVERVTNVQRNRDSYYSFRANMAPATVAASTAEVTDMYQTASEISYMMCANPGRGKVGSLNYEAGIINKVSVGDVVSYTFSEPFDDVPVVLATPQYSSSTKYPLFWRVFNVTREGFQLALQRQHSLDSDLLRPQATISFIAMEKGETPDGTGKLITVNDSLVSFSSSASLSRSIKFGGESNKQYINAMPLMQFQTMNREIAAVLRLQNSLPRTTATIRVRAQVDNTNTELATVSSENKLEERIGWILISDDPDYSDGIETIAVTPTPGNITAYPSVVTQMVCVRDDAATSVSVFAMNGQMLMSAPLYMGQTNIDMTSLPAGMYILRSNAGHSVKVIKK